MSILALAASVVVLNAPPSYSPSRKAADEFAARARAAIAASVIEGAPYRIEIRQSEYAVSRFAGEAWEPASRTKVGSLSDDIQFRVEIKDAALDNAWALNGEMADLTDQNDKALIILIDPYGGGPSVAAHFESRRSNWTVLIAPDGEILTQKQ